MSNPALVGAAPEAIDASATDDPRDLAAACGGDHAAFARIYDRHAPVVLSICRRYAGSGMHDHAEAEDALQETFIRAYRLLDTIDQPQRLRSWLFGIARRVCSERRRGESRRHRHEEDAMTAFPVRDHDPATATLAAEQGESMRRLDSALEALPDEERLAIHLYYLDPDPVRAAQECLALSRSGFYKLLARARARLSRLMLEAPAP